MTQSLPRNGTHGSLQHTRSTDDLLGTAARSNGALNSTTLHVDPPARGTTNPVLGDAAAGRFVKPAREASAFGAVAYIVSKSSSGKPLREHLASVVTANTVTNTSAEGRKAAKDYVKLLHNSTFVGGIAELHYLSQYYAMEMVVFESVNDFEQEAITIGANRGYLQRAYLHVTIECDYRVFERGTSRQTVFSCEDEEALIAAQEDALRPMKHSRIQRLRISTGITRSLIITYSCVALLVGIGFVVVVSFLRLAGLTTMGI